MNTTQTERVELVERLRKRAEIRRSMPHRKSVQEGQPDRIADLLEEAASAIELAPLRPVEASPLPGDAIVVQEIIDKCIGVNGYGGYTGFNRENAKSILARHREQATAPLLDVLHEIHDRAHDLSTGPTVYDGYWEIRQMASDALAAHPTKAESQEEA